MIISTGVEVLLSAAECVTIHAAEQETSPDRDPAGLEDRQSLIELSQEVYS